jgi:hypothetical protein
MQDTENEAKWRAEFEKYGERAVHDTLYHGPGVFDEPKRLFTIRWLGEQEKDRNDQDRKTRCYVRWTFWAALAAVAVGVIGVAVTWWGAK